ncbi:RNA polymerase sigma factor [Lysobacter soyae]|uniref:RNA polymerase sigma factor n=2 Tax=Lysobacter soyae TaxID=2764185 RepID=A0ABX8WRQ7_9GAMM|nr:RNA polymerase sigma factor [Lysobacter sp. CJ11]
MCPDAGLVPRMSEGIDTKTWPNINAFFKDVNARAFRFAEYGLRSREDAMDAVQDAMLKMLAYGDRPSNEWTPLFWRILRTRVIDMQRRRKFRLSWMLGGVEEDSSVAWADTSADPARAHDNREAFEHFSVAMGKLPARQREAFNLRVLEELDVATTASVMGCSEGSVKTHLSRARAALQPYLEDFS